MHKLKLISAVVVAAIGILTAILWNAEDLGREYDATLGERISRIYAGATLQAWREASPSHYSFQWQLFHDPEFPEIGFAYANHPPLILLWQYAADRILGPSDQTMRRAAVAYSALSLLFLALFASRTQGYTLIWLSFFASSGAFLVHADLACPPLFGLPPSILLVLAYAHWRTSRQLHGKVTILCSTLVCSLSDWNAWGMIGAVLFDLLRTGVPFRARLQLALAISAAAICGLLIHVTLAFFAFGGADSFELAMSRILGVLESGSAAKGGNLAILANYATQARDHFGLPLLALAGVGITGSGFIRAEMARVSARLALVGGVIALVVLRTRAVDHPFWISVLTPGVTASAALVPILLWERISNAQRPYAALATLALGIACAWTGVHIAREDRLQSGEPMLAAIGRSFDREFGKDDLLIGFDALECAVRPSMKVTLSCCMPADEPSFDALLNLYGNERIQKLDRIVLVLHGGVAAAMREPSFPFIATLPVRKDTLRRIEGPVPYDAIELDKAELLKRRREKGLK